MVDLNAGLDRLAGKFQSFSWSMVLVILPAAAIGLGMLYSAGNMSWDPWASRQAIHFVIGFACMIVIAILHISFWLKAAWWLYGLVLALLVGVELFGQIGGGARRWIDLQVVRLQPSEWMKVALVLALARWFHLLSFEEIGRLRNLVVPVLLIAAPTLLVIRQPDLGTAIALSCLGIAMLFLAGVRWWLFAVGLSGLIAALPVVWEFLLRPYQKQRILTFLNPGQQPQGAGYHIQQSKIALGSGGFSGKGFGNGTQSHLHFLPEKQTDFIFTMLGEELGLIGAMFVIGLFFVLLLYGYVIGWLAGSSFGRLVAMGLSVNLFLYVFTNVGMVTGMLPVVGMPLPLISYGGTALIGVMAGFGLILNVSIHSKYRMTSFSDGSGVQPVYRKQFPS